MLKHNLMPSVKLHPPSTTAGGPGKVRNPLPQILQTPSGLAILEVQGTLNAPAPNPSVSKDAESDPTLIGRLVFPLHDASDPPEDRAWMRRVYLYVGKNQRLTGEVKQLPKALAIIRKKDVDQSGERSVGQDEELEIVDIVKYKIIFSHRPEPVSG